MTGQLSPLAQGKAAGTAGYTSKMLATSQTTQRDSELDDGYYEIGVAKSYTVNTSGSQSGTTTVDLTHMDTSTAVSFDSGTKEIRGIGLMSAFKTNGGETIVVSGATNAGNNGVFTTASATADKIVVAEALTNESAGASVVIKKRDSISNNTVLDNNTGLEWLRYLNTKFGSNTYANGRLPWTGYPFDAFAYCAACNAASLGGHNDWRIPNIFELWNMMKLEPTSGFDSTAFPSGIGTCSSTTQPSTSTNLLYISSTTNAKIEGVAKSNLGGTYSLVRGGTA